IYACPVGAYYSQPLKVRIEEVYTRASKGGVGSAKCAGNYAASMYPARLAQKEGFDQVLWTDGENHEFLEELGTSNIFIVTEDAVLTPELNDSLLAGITRDSIIKLLRHNGTKVIEKKISVSELIDLHKNNEIKEMFVTGTAATVTNIKLFNYKNTNYDINHTGDLISVELKNILNDMKRLVVPDDFDWIVSVDESELTANS